MLREELWKDVGALGGFPLYVVVLALTLAMHSTYLFWSALIGLAISFVITVLIRTLYFKERPIKELYKTFSGKIHASTFPSWHTMRASLLATILTLAIQNIPLSIFLFIAAAGVGHSRVRSKRHFVKDVVAGYIMGVVIALISLFIAFNIPYFS